MQSNQILNSVYYCTAITSNNSQRKRQSVFFQANNLNPKFNLVYGKFIEKEVVFGGKKYKTFEEKQTDVNIAVKFIENIIKDKCDTSIIVSADSDLIPAAELAKDIYPLHKIYCHFPPKRYSSQLKNTSDGFIQLERYESRFKRNLLNDKTRINPNVVIERPHSWR